MLLVTGGSGFIGSHLVDSLLKGKEEVIVLDNLVSGNISNLAKQKNNRNLKLIEKSILDRGLEKQITGTRTIFHFAADPSVKESSSRPVENFNVNVLGTLKMLELARKLDVKNFIFASSSTVYGNAPLIPTPETSPTTPISNYGSSKLAAEAYVCSYANTYGIKSTSLRFANIFGPRSKHGVCFDFYEKLKGKPTELQILGNGRQAKSYLYISDCIAASLLCYKKQEKIYDVFNVGSKKTTTVIRIAHMISRYLKLNPAYRSTGGSGGWIGDVPKMQLDTKKIMRLGWREKVTVGHGLTMYLEWLDWQKSA